MSYNENHSEVKLSRKAQWGRSIETETMENNRFERLRQFHGDLPVQWFAFTRDSFYLYSNESQTDYTVLIKAKISSRNSNAIDLFVKELKNGTYGSTEALDYWTTYFRRGKGRDSWYYVGSGRERAADRTDGVDGRTKGVCRQRGENDLGHSWESGGDIQQGQIDIEEDMAQKNTAEAVRSGAKYSLKRIGGKNVVWIKNNLLTNKQLIKQSDVADCITQYIGEVYTILESGSKVYIEKDLPNEYTQSKYTKYIREGNRPKLKAKGKVVSDLGLLIESARNRRWEHTRHSHNKDAKYGFYRYDSTFAFPVKDSAGKTQNVRAYDVELLIRNASDGRKYLYDIVNIKEDTATENNLEQSEIRLATQGAAPRSNVPNNSIPGSSGNVNIL